MTTTLRQKDALSPILFKLLLEKLIHEMNVSEGVTPHQITIVLLAYVDDIVLLEEDIDMIKQLSIELVNTEKRWVLTLMMIKLNT